MQKWIDQSTVRKVLVQVAFWSFTGVFMISCLMEI